MERLRRGVATYWKGIGTIEKYLDRWVLKNIVSLWTQTRFAHAQKLHNRGYKRFNSIIKLFLLGYLTFNLGQIDINQHSFDGHIHVSSEYEILSNHVERDHFQQVGRERYLQWLFNRGKRHGLSQVQLFQLSKYLDLNYTTKVLVPHVEYLQNLKGK